MDYKLCVFDIDGTLVQPKSGATFRKTADDWQWLPGRLERLRLLQAQGVKTATATNQGGIAFGYMQESDMLKAMLTFGNEGQFDTMRVCYTHPKASIEQYRADDSRRKPGAGMLLEIMDELCVPPVDTLYVGDRDEDRLAAEAAGVAFVHADEFFAQHLEGE